VFKTPEKEASDEEGGHVVSGARAMEAVEKTLTERGRAIGVFGTLARVVCGLGLLYLPWLDDGLQLHDVLLGLVGFPAIVLLWQWLRLRRTAAPLRATGVVGHLVNCGIAAVLLLTPATADAADLFYGTSMLLAALRGFAGCEVLAVSNWLLRRDDQVGCPVFLPIDAIESRVVGTGQKTGEQ
jgi:hypothetical protein